jgi:hypothetical protein
MLEEEIPLKKIITKNYRARVLIENSFGLLKGRFNQLRYIKFHSIEKTSRFVKACCAMHNICIDRADHWDENEVQPRIPINNDDDTENISSTQIRRQGELKRTRIAQMLV